MTRTAPCVHKKNRRKGAEAQTRGHPRGFFAGTHPHARTATTKFCIIVVRGLVASRSCGMVSVPNHVYLLPFARASLFPQVPFVCRHYAVFYDHLKRLHRVTIPPRHTIYHTRCACERRVGPPPLRHHSVSAPSSFDARLHHRYRLGPCSPSVIGRVYS